MTPQELGSLRNPHTHERDWRGRTPPSGLAPNWTTSATSTATTSVSNRPCASPVTPRLETRSDAEGLEFRSVLNVGDAGRHPRQVRVHRRQEVRSHYGLSSNQVPLSMLRGSPWRHGRPWAPAHHQHVFPSSVAAFLGIAVPGRRGRWYGRPARASTPMDHGRVRRGRAAPVPSCLVLLLPRGPGPVRHHGRQPELADGLSKQIIAGQWPADATNGQPQRLYRELYRAFAYGRVEYASGRHSDGRWHPPTLEYRGNNDNMDALMLMDATAGVRVSAHVPAVASTKQNVIVIGNARDMVAFGKA